MLKKILLSISVIIAIVGAIVAYRTITNKSKQISLAAIPAPELPENAIEHLQKAIQCATISFADSSVEKAKPFVALKNLIETAYPLVNKTMSREIIGGFSYLYKWEGKNPALAPYIFMAHQDVVPIEESSRHLWKAEPFSGALIENTIYGRGAIDNKCNLISMLEASEKLLRQGFQPERTIYYIFGEDEEIGGIKGALPISKLFEARGIKAELLIDEGGIVTKEKVPGVSKPVALLGTAEKGYLTLEFSVQKKGGHSSMPDRETAIDILMAALTKVHDNPFPARFDKATQGFLDYLGPEMKFPNNMAFANQWLFKSLIVKGLDKSPPTRAMIHTTAVTTIIDAGVKENVVPTMATATVNMRLLPNDSAKFVIEKIKKIINDERVVITIKNDRWTEGSTSPIVDGIGFQKINRIVRQTYDNVLVTPFLMIGGTDSKYYEKVCDNIIKFSPVLDPIGFHTHDEQVSIESFKHSVWFFEQLIRDAK